MWYQVFLWNLFSSIFCHFVASAIAFARLRKHKIGRFIPAIVLVMGFLSPLTGGVVTSKWFTVTSLKAVKISSSKLLDLTPSNENCSLTDVNDRSFLASKKKTDRYIWLLVST